MSTQLQYHESILLSPSELFFPFKLVILKSLYKEKRISFVELQKRLDTTSGNLVGHLRMLEKDNLVNVRKEFRNNKPHTTYPLTEKGTNEFIKLKERLIEFLE